jgi:O-antigen/teichoic acid export membrane protein
MNTPKKILKGFFYAVGGGYVARFGSVALTFLLRDELGLEAFDSVLYGWLIFFMLSSLREFHLLQGLLHFQDEVDQFVRTHFTLNLIICSLWCLFTCGVAAALWRWDPECDGWTAGVVCFFAIFHWFRNLTLTSEALLRMDFAYGRLSLIHGFGSLLALSLALVAAWGGWGKWSLLLGGWSSNAVFSLVYVVFFSAGVWFSRPVRFWPLQLDRFWARRLLRYGAPLWGGWIVQNFVWNYDKLVVKWQLGERSLTYYESAWWLMQIPTAMITHIIFTYTNTLYSRYQNDRQRLSEFYGLMMQLIVRVSAPIALIFVFNADDIVSPMGEKWSAAAPIIVWLAAYAFLRPLLDDSYNLFMAVGASRMGGLVMLLPAAVALVLVPVMVHFAGVQGAAYSMGVVAGIGVLTMAWGLRRHVDVPWLRIFSAPILALFCSALGGRAYEEIALGIDWADLCLRSAVLGGVYLAVLWGAERRAMAGYLLQIRRIMRGE